ncbi:hypothetical protein JCM10212_006641 [Sporobolomyces blumeae]
MSSHTDPAHRRPSYHASPLSTASVSDAQHRRRVAALDAQKQRRTHAIQAARDRTARELDLFEDMSIAGDDLPETVGRDNDDDDDDDDWNPSQSSRPNAAQGQENDNLSEVPPPKISKQKRRSYKPVFKSWAKNLLSHAETLDLRHGLPLGLADEWRLSVVPKGKRCLCATTNGDKAGKNTILYSRVAGRTLGRFRTSLPPDCLLDVVWDRELSVMWVLDTCKWRSTYTVECDADFRAFFTSSKLSELDTQFYIPPSPTLSGPSGPSTASIATSLLVLPCPSYSSPLVPSTLLPILTNLSSRSLFSVQVYTPSRSPAVETASPSTPPPSSSSITLSRLEVPFVPTGVLLYVKSAHYESGLTPLVNWVPVDVVESSATVEPSQGPTSATSAGDGDRTFRSATNRDVEGVERFIELVTEWERQLAGASELHVANEGEAMGS